MRSKAASDGSVVTFTGLAVNVVGVSHLLRTTRGGEKQLARGPLPSRRILLLKLSTFLRKQSFNSSLASAENLGWRLGRATLGELLSAFHLCGASHVAFPAGRVRGQGSGSGVRGPGLRGATVAAVL